MTMSTVQKSVIDEDEIDTVLEADIQFSGTLETSKSLLIKGKISGAIICGDDLYISERASVDADVRAGRVTVRGVLKGSIIASESIQLMAGSDVEANLEAPDIVIENEEHFKGTATITGNQEDA
jgi:cytoskeletal protein CcmA (bactofilin family)